MFNDKPWEEMSETEINALVHNRVLNMDEPFAPEYTRGGKALDQLKDHFDNFCITKWMDKNVVSIYGDNRHANVGMAETEGWAFCQAALKWAGVFE